jgi:hypothetical protein
MDKPFDINKEGYSVRCRLFYEKDVHAVDKVVVATHGFGGFKDNKSLDKFAERLYTKLKGFGIIAFDFPCHGQDARKKLLLSECQIYLKLVIDYALEQLKAQALYNYSVSFGAFNTLKYIAEQGNPFTKIALRSTSVKLYNIMYESISDDDHKKLARGKEVLAGRDRKMKISEEFLESLKTTDEEILNFDYVDYAESMLMIHGVLDDMVPIQDARDFSLKNIIELVEIEKADHRFSNPPCMDQAIARIIDFFAQSSD